MPPRWADLLKVGAIVLLSTVGVFAVRPFFAEYAAAGGASPAVAALLFSAPSVAVLAVLPAAGWLRSVAGRRLLPLAFVVAAVALGWQAVSADPAWLAGGRLLFGAGLGLGQAALDERVLAVTGTAGPAYSLVAAAQSIGLLIAPLVATVAATYMLAAPLLAGAAAFAALAVLAPPFVPPVPPSPDEGDDRQC